MREKIAVCVDASGATVSLYETGKIIIYEKLEGRWQENQSCDSGLGQVSGIKELRLQMTRIIKYLGDCRIFVAQNIAGVPYFELEKAEVSVWEITGHAEDLLEEIWQSENEKSALVQPPVEMIAPHLVQTFPGCFRISLVEIQSSDSFLTTKQVLLPILRKADFYTLEVLCNHVPPWLELELESGNYQSYIERLRGESKIIIKAKNCPNEICDV